MKKIALALFSATMMLSAGGTQLSPVPEPSTYLMMGAGLGALIYVRNRFNKK
ncbi:MAG: PEP-CTERM sorting domain-containing protein [Acidobacteria bacterium]|nr:PEP-CTERM sorting domain-containing protein [Acidobacteriota bacterium]